MERVDIIARAICKSGKFETGQGTCAVICMDHLGVARTNCSHASRVHAALAQRISDALEKEAVNAG
jgi:hypothetical protein